MEKLPLEVLHIICSHLEFRDAANVRFVSRKLATVAAAHLVKNVRFHTSHESLNRLKNISKHPIFRKTVTSLTYEAALLADVRCRHEYARHFELDHHGLERPREPSPSCSKRERRLYERNNAKWLANIHSKWAVYRSLFEGQNLLLTKNSLEGVLAQCIPRFTKLKALDLDPIRRCSHRTSERFMDEYGSDCASPLSANTNRTSSLLKFILIPGDRILSNLRSLEANSLNPVFFNKYAKTTLIGAFRSLTHVDISFKLPDEMVTTEEPRQRIYDRILSNGNLRDVLHAAQNLESLCVGFDAPGLHFVNMSHILKDSVWNKLTSISLTLIMGTEDELMVTLKRQPALRKVNLALCQLTEGSWPDVVDRVRSDLSLESFEPIGFLEDSEESWPMDLLCVPVYVDTFIELDLSTAINAYVTGRKGEKNVPNPLGEGYKEFEEGDIVRDIYGTQSELESDLLDDSDISISDISDSDTDTDMPDLASYDTEMTV